MNRNTNRTALLFTAAFAVAITACSATNANAEPVRSAASSSIRAPITFDATLAEKLLDEAELGKSKSAGAVQRMLLDQHKSLDRLQGNLAFVRTCERAYRIFGTKKLNEMAQKVRAASNAPVIAGAPSM